MKTPLSRAIAAALFAAAGLAACQPAEETQSATTAAKTVENSAEVIQTSAAPQLGSGIDTDGFDRSVRPQDDLFAYVNGTWIANTELPPDRARWGSFDALADKSEQDVRALVEVVDLLGRVQATALTEVSEERVRGRIDLSVLPAGVYFLRITSGRNTATQKFILR